MTRRALLLSILSTSALYIAGCSSPQPPSGITGGYYTSADCQGKSDAIYDPAKAADKVVVIKGERKMYLYKGGSVIDTFSVSLGKKDHLGNKVKRGDKRTPVGKYTILNKRCHSVKYRAMTISYPNSQDVARAARLGVDPGSLITIHGQPHWNADGHGDRYTLANDWTDGCVALTNSDLDKLWGKVRVGTIIEIKN